MTDIAEFVLARTAGREAAVFAWDSDGRARIATMWLGPEPGYTTVAADHSDEHWVTNGRQVVSPRRVQILFDPTAVLARCAVDRAIVAEHRQGTFTDVSLGLKDVSVCIKCHSAMDVPDWDVHGDDWTYPFVQDAWPCQTMRLLASLDAGHPDYDESWAASCSA